VGGAIFPPLAEFIFGFVYGFDFYARCLLSFVFRVQCSMFYLSTAFGGYGDGLPPAENFNQK
jgi:hypothetical protein